jgi:hypothetical protein
MWTDRNDMLHGDGNTIHHEEIKSINEELLKQWMEEIYNLPQARHQHLF